ncbi:MAG TPA: hypothetical protein DHV62_06250 [Elusimicrobia bacterium]|jgi:hypothetical protein|nr:hypothetical protein [Elusimicrobiota bacterium]
MGKIGKYIYGIIDCSTFLYLSTPKNFFDVGKNGANGIYPVRNSAELKVKQQNFSANAKTYEISNGVYTISYRDISALVKDSEIFDYTQLLKDAIARLSVEHQMIIEKIMDLETAIIPMELGTFAQDEVEVRNILDKGYNLIKNTLEKVNDRIEIGLVATWSDFNSVLKEIGKVKEIEDFKESFLSNPKGCTIDEQIKVGIMVKKLLDEKRKKYTKEIRDTLKTVSQDYKMHKVTDDRMVINAAFLVDKIKQKDFEREVENLNTKFCERLNFRTISPLLPYSFYTLEIKKWQFEEIDWARKKLGLKNFMTKEGQCSPLTEKME